ncbi:hypothetical protein RO21_06860 [[Actinobacillus] muris]|uniref:YtfJ family protein n=1 Tax=Muribacter muris TaxID=67855 RepID=A0A0J5P4H9_9PAST|nr:YtfJ family protein [Muribacter muris]KMK51333.1 hypothetical protein RO21_06860 [[Actinobacillus] muris] [Muribacter muris]
MKNFSVQAVLFGLFFANSVFAHNVQLNAPLPSAKVIKDGELMIEDKEIIYKPWSSAQLRGKVRVVHHLAGRSSVKEKNQPLMAAIKAAGFNRNHYQTTTIINADDAVIATGLFVKNSAEDGKRQNPHSQVILDQSSQVKKAWQLKAKESFIAVLDKQGKVQFVAEGKLSADQTKQVIELVKQLLNN